MSHYRCFGACCAGAKDGLFWAPRRNFLLAGLGAAATAVFPHKQAMATPAGDRYYDLWSKPRVLTLYRKETGERGSIEYWRNGQLQLDGWYQLLHLLRDVEAGVAMHYDPAVVDLVWACQEWTRLDTGKLHMFRLTEGARTEETNRRTPNAAPHSEHKKGRAVDGRLEGLDLKLYARAARFFQVGGVGLYTSHVHVDSGAVRSWRS